MVLNRYCTSGQDVIWNIGIKCILWENGRLYHRRRYHNIIIIIKIERTRHICFIQCFDKLTGLPMIFTTLRASRVIEN